MQKIYIRNYGEERFEFFMSEDEYKNRVYQELKALRLNLDDDDCIDETDYDLVAIVEFEGERCETIADVILELERNEDINNVVLPYEKSLMKENNIEYSVKGNGGDKIKIEFEIVEEDEESILDSKINNVRLVIM